MHYTPPVTTIPISAALRARLRAEAPHLHHTVREAHTLDDAAVVDSAALPAVDTANAAANTNDGDDARLKAALGAHPGSSAGLSTLWQHVPHDDPDALLDDQLRAALITLLARGTPITPATLSGTLENHLHVDANLADAVAAEVNDALQRDAAMLPVLRTMVEDDNGDDGDDVNKDGGGGGVDGMGTVRRATVVTVSRPQTAASGSTNGSTSGDADG
jgi:hypothetical protein